MTMHNPFIKVIRAICGDMFIGDARVPGVEEDSNFTHEWSFNIPRLKSLKVQVVFRESGATGMVDADTQDEALSKLIDIFYQEFE